MAGFRLLLIVQLIALTIYTVPVVADHGWNYLPHYVRVLGELDWPGQFAADLTVFLMLGGLWVAWRNRFSATGIAMGALVMTVGTAFIAPYLLYLSWRERGDVPRMLVGDRIGSMH